jgi:DNA-binding PadR family transcriptional regulator
MDEYYAESRQYGMGRGRGMGRGMRGMEGPGGWAAGPGPGPGWGGGRRRMRRGGIRRAVLAALRDGPAHGYEVMRSLEERSGGIWRPSPGSVYPTLQMLEDEGLVRSETREGTRTYELTDAGRAESEPKEGEGRGAPWDFGGEKAEQARALRSAVVQVHMATRQMATAGSREQADRGLEILQRARRELYQVLAEG